MKSRLAIVALFSVMLTGDKDCQPLSFMISVGVNIASASFTWTVLQTFATSWQNAYYPNRAGATTSVCQDVPLIRDQIQAQPYHVPSTSSTV